MPDELAHLPAPTRSTVLPSSPSKMCRAISTAAEAIEVAARPSSVSVRTRLALPKAAAQTRVSSPRAAPMRCASSKASFTWPRICGSPSTIESRLADTRKRWCSAASPWCA